MSTLDRFYFATDTEQLHNYLHNALLEIWNLLGQTPLKPDETTGPLIDLRPILPIYTTAEIQHEYASSPQTLHGLQTVCNMNGYRLDLQWRSQPAGLLRSMKVDVIPQDIPNEVRLSRPQPVLSLFTREDMRKAH